jgi:SAM-dependent methyltransferase
MGIDLYGKAGLDIYERTHYSRDEHVEEVRQILSWLPEDASRLLDVGCSAGLHALEFARRGFSVTGIDIERFAVARAQERSRKEKLPARFKVAEITRDGLSGLGRFDFIYSLGNVLSHIGKSEIPGLLKKVRAGLNAKGIFLFDLLIKGSPFRTRIRDDYHKILWERELDERTGRIGMDGFFLEFGITQHFDVWGYSVEEALELVAAAGFSPADVSDRLDFATAADEGSNPFCLNFRATPRRKDEGVHHKGSF